MKSTQEQVRRRGQWPELQQEEIPAQDEPRECRQAVKTKEQTESEQQQQQRRQQTPSHSLLPFSLQFNANATHLSRAQHAREEWPQTRNHYDKQQEEQFRKKRLLPRYCSLSEIDRPGTSQQHRQQVHEDCTDEQHQQQHAQQGQAAREQDHSLQAQKEECRVRRIHFHHNQQYPFHPYIKCESTMHHTHAAGGRKVLGATLNREETKVTTADFTSRVQPLDEEHVRMGAETSVLLGGRPSVATSHGYYQSISFPCTAALAEEKASPAAAAAVRPGSCGASVADFVSAGSSGIPTVPLRTLGVAASLAAACQDTHSATAAGVASSSNAAVVALGDNTTRCARRTGAEAAPRRKQLSGAQKRKRKRELMAKCRVEQSSLLSFLGTTVTSELILNDWYALESQLRDECAYFERLSSSAWNLPAALSPHSSIASDSSPAAPLSSSDAGDHPDAASDGTQLPMLRFLKSLGNKRLNNIAPPRNKQRQDDFHCQERQQKPQLCPERQSGDQYPEELQLLTRLNDELGTETRQQHFHSGQERGEADALMRQMPTTEAHGSGFYSWLNDSRTVIPRDATDQVFRNLDSSPIVKSFVYNNADCTVAYDVRHLESSASGCRSNTSEVVNTGSITLSSSLNGDIMPQWGCGPIFHRYEGFPGGDGKSQVLLSGSTTPSSNSNNSTSWEARTPISSHGTATKSSCRTDDNEEQIENKDLLSSSAVESGEEIQTQVREMTFAARPESRHLSNPDTVKGDMQPQESHVHLPGTMLHSDYVISAADILKRGNTRDERSNGTIDSYGRVSRPSCEDTSVEEKNIVGDETGCFAGARSVDSTSCHSSSKQGDRWKLRGRSDLHQSSERVDADPSTCADGRVTESCCLISKTTSIAKGCCPGEKGDLESTWWSSLAYERCSRETSNFKPSSLVCSRISKDLFDTSTHDATASALSRACVSKVPSSAVGGVADPLIGDDGPVYSFRDAFRGGYSLLLCSGQQQHQKQHGPLHSLALWVTDDAARPDVEGQSHRDVQAETQLLTKGDSSTMRHYGKGGEDRATEGSYGTTRRSSAATVVETTETGPESNSTQTNSAREDPNVISRTDKSSSSTAGAVTHRRRSLSDDTIRFPANWLSSSTPSSPQKRRSTSERHSSSEPKSLAGLLAACKERESSAVADDEASTASSSPAPVLQPPPAPLLCLHPLCDCKRSNRLSPCAFFAEAENIGAATLPECVGRCRLPANLQRQPELLALPQQLTAQQGNLVQQRAVQLQPKQQKSESLISGHRQSMIPPEQQQKTSHGLGVPPQQDAHKNLLNRRETSTAVHVSEGTRLLMVQQQCRVSKEEAESALYDPALWPAQLSDALRSSLVKRGPVQIVDFDFPRDSTQRRFGRQHYWRTAATGERYWRSWLVYSKSRDAVYCFCCKLYSQLAKSVVSTGFRRWKGAAEVLRSHEQSRDHRTCMLQWKCMCVKVGAEVAFGDLMQLWLPNGLSTASAASLEGTSTSGAVSGATAPACVKAADKDETVTAHATETKVHACSPKRETEAHRGTAQKCRTEDVTVGPDIERGARRWSPCEAVTGDDAAVEEGRRQDIFRARSTEANSWR